MGDKRAVVPLMHSDPLQTKSTEELHADTVPAAAPDEPGLRGALPPGVRGLSDRRRYTSCAFICFCAF